MFSEKTFGIIGLGKMGGNIARNAIRSGWRVVGYNRTTEVTDAMVSEGLVAVHTLADMIASLPTPRVIWVMLPAGQPTEDMLFGEAGIVGLLSQGDVIIEAGNSLYTDDVARIEKLSGTGIRYIDLGVSGGPAGALNGACIMAGGDADLFTELKPLLTDLAAPEALQHFPGVGAGHFVKMVHNGIEYGMMQAIAEGMEVLKASPLGINLADAARIYNHRSVIESRLVGWLEEAYAAEGTELEAISSTVAHTGEGAWTVDAAHALNVQVPVIEASLEFRKQSADHPSYAGRVLSALRNRFGGHAAKE